MEIQENFITKLFDDKSVHFIEDENHLKVCANDVMLILGYSEPRKAWYDMKPIVEEALDRTVGIYPTHTKKGIYHLAYLDREQLIVLLLKSQKPSAKPFLKWAVNILSNEIDYKFQQLQEELNIIKSQPINFTIPSEETLRDQLIHLSAYCSSGYNWEFSVRDSFREGKARRWDAYKKFGRVCRIIELKREISSSEIDNILNDRCYLELAANLSPGKLIDLVFVAPTITDSARRTLERLGAESEYKWFTVAGITYRAKIRAMSIYDLAEGWINRKVSKTNPNKECWNLTKEAYTKWRNVVSHDYLKFLMENYPIYLPKDKVIPLEKKRAA